MENQFDRTERIIGERGVALLKDAAVAVFGIGGVGGYAAEALVRAGIGRMDIIDKDEIDITNLNRQIIALHSTVGQDKVTVMKKRLLDINPEAEIHAFKCLYLPDTAESFDLSNYDYIVDAVDNVTAKIELAVRANAAGTPIISSMGTGNKLDPEKLTVATIEQTSVCPLAKVMRKELRKREIHHLKVVFSKEEPKKQAERGVPGSISFVPSAAGLLLAGEVVKDLIGEGC